MNQRVCDIVSEEVIDESTIKKEVEEAKQALKEKVGKEGKPTSIASKRSSAKKKGNRAKHSKRFLELQAKIENKTYPLSEAIDKILETAKINFDSTIELHSRLLISGIRGTVLLPSGAPKEKRVFELTEDNLADFTAKVKAGKLDFDLLITKPAMMPKIAPLAKILGPKGLMPTPKAGTVVEDTKTAIEEIKSGKVEYKQDDQNNIHLAIGKASWGKEKIQKNVEAVLKVLPKNKIASVYLTSTMGPSVKVELPK